MRDALAGGDAARIEQVLGEIDAGVRESYGDVRELLLHFRTRSSGRGHRARAADHAAQVRAPERPAGDAAGGETVCRCARAAGAGAAHPAGGTVQRAQSTRASRVWLDVQQQPQWRFEVRDDGIGFDHDPGTLDETHVGLRIMQERAERIGAIVEVHATPRQGHLGRPHARAAGADQPAAPDAAVQAA